MRRLTPELAAAAIPLQIRVTLTHGLPLAIDLFSLLHDGVTYHFTYYTSPALIGAERSIFGRSARSIK